MTFDVNGSSTLTRRTLLGGAASTFGAAVAMAAPGPVSPAGVAAAVRDLGRDGATLRLLAPEGSAANVRPVAEAFLAATGVRVEVLETAVDEINTQLTLDALGGGGGGYDLALPATFGLPDLAASGAIRPITDFAARYEAPGFRDDILYAVGDSFDGEIYGFQTDGDAYVMFYHKDWLTDPAERARYEDRFGHPLATPRTWTELDRQMAYFHRPDERRYGGALFRTPGYLAWEWWIRFHAEGVWPLSADLEPQIASDAGVAALEAMIRASETLYPHARSAGLFDNWRHYAEGETYCNIGWGGTQKFLNGPGSGMRGRMVYGQTPGGDLGGDVVATPYFNWGWNYVVAAISTQPELAYLFALYATTAEASTSAVREREGFFDPFRPEHYDDPVIEDIYSRAFLTVHETSLRGAIPDLYLAGQSEYIRTLTEQLDAAINQGADPRGALERAATQWSVLNLRAGSARQTERWLALRAKYPENIRNRLRDIA